ncbi:MAG: NADPH:quinone oxidoreductase family protein [Caulobacterales bacterium]
MRALLSGDLLGPDGLSLQEISIPSPGPGQVRIRVVATAVNYPDVLMIEDRYQYKPPRPFSPGGEVAGLVDAVGSGVEGLLPGDRVLALTLFGGMAEYVLAPANRVSKIPQSMPFEDAAALVMTYGTALHALEERAHLQSGETVLVLGAAGGVGLAAVELANALGAQVVGAVSSQEKADFAQKCGAHRTVIYPSGPLDQQAQRALAAQFKEACGADGAHVVVDVVGGAYSEPALRAIAWHGRFLVVGFPAGIASIPMNLPLLKACQIIGVFLGGESERDPKGFQNNVTRLLGLYGDGKIRPKIDQRLPLAEGARAIKLLADRKARGKVVVTIDAAL